jgi:hypothetical protein
MNIKVGNFERKGQVIRLVMVVLCKRIGFSRKRFDSFTAHENKKVENFIPFDCHFFTRTPFIFIFSYIIKGLRIFSSFLFLIENSTSTYWATKKKQEF